MNLKLNKEIEIPTSFVKFNGRGFNYYCKVTFFDFQHQISFCGVLDFLGKKYEKKKIHNMLSLILNPKF
jgi:hypothetical protein